MALSALVLAAAFSPTGLIIWLIGAFLGGLIANLLIPDANFGLIGSIIVAIIGACILIAILRAVTRSRRV